MRSKRFGNRVILVILTLSLLSPAPAAGASLALSTRHGPPAPRVFEGYGEFPRIATIAPSGDEGALGLYLVDGDSARLLLDMPDLNWGAATFSSQLSPDGRHLAACFRGGDTAPSQMDLFDLEAGSRTTITRGAGELQAETEPEGRAYEEVTSVAWLDDAHLLYSKVTWSASPVERGEVWVSSLDGENQKLLGTGYISRVLGASPDGQTIYVTRFIPGEWDWQEEGFALLDVASGQVRYLWPKEDRSTEAHYSFELVRLPDGSRKLLFATGQRVSTAVAEPPVIWVADPETEQAEQALVVSQGRDQGKSTAYDLPRQFLWSPVSSDEFLYLADGAGLGGIWTVDLATHTSSPVPGTESLGDMAGRILAWAPEGIVTKDAETLRLLSETGEPIGEIVLGDSAPLTSQGIADAKVNWPVPFIHQMNDVPEWFNGGWSCGPTSMVMILAYFGRLAKHPITVNHGQGPHVSDYGFYVAEEYSHQCGREGPPSYTFSGTAPVPPAPPGEPPNLPGKGAHGQCVDAGGGAIAGLMFRYAERHDVGHYYLYPAGTQDEVKRLLDAGSVVALGTRLTTAGHIVVAKGYYESGGTTYFIVNDPNVGQRDLSWSQMVEVKHWVAYHGPQVFPHVERLAGSLGSTLRVANTERGAWRSSHVQVCLLNQDGSVAATPQLAIGLSEVESLALSNVSGISDGWQGSAILRAYNPSGSYNTPPFNNTPGFASAVVHNARRHATDGGAVLPTERDAYEGILTTYEGSLSGGGVGPQLLFPSVLRNYYGWYTSIYLMNAGGQPTSATIHYYNAVGGWQGSVTYNLPPFTRVRWTNNAVDRGSARAVSSNGQPLAATVVQERGSGVYATWSMSQEYPASNRGGDRGFLPSLLRDYYTWTSAYVNRAVDYYVSGSAYFYPNGTSRSFYLGNGNASEEVYLSVPAPTPTVVPSGFHGSGTVDKTGGSGTVATVGQHSNTQTAMGLRAPAGGHREVTIPYLNSADETASLIIQNTSAAPITITANYYDGQSGNLELSYPRSGIQPGHSVELLVGSGVPASFRGSVWVQALEARGRVAVSVQQSQANDNGYGYSLP
ncbi:MAG: hypothetical protein HPY83_14870 [Anaerolineae bacterium]|nr:hypothetical protein [Anaerolineae bacterium]